MQCNSTLSVTSTLQRHDVWTPWAHEGIFTNPDLLQGVLGCFVCDATCAIQMHENLSKILMPDLHDNIHTGIRCKNVIPRFRDWKAPIVIPIQKRSLESKWFRYMVLYWGMAAFISLSFHEQTEKGTSTKVHWLHDSGKLLFVWTTKQVQ